MKENLGLISKREKGLGSYYRYIGRSTTAVDAFKDYIFDFLSVVASGGAKLVVSTGLSAFFILSVLADGVVAIIALRFLSSCSYVQESCLFRLLHCQALENLLGVA